MIWVDRDKVAKPSILDKKDSSGKTETERAIAHYHPFDPKKDPFKFSVYSKSEVKQALIQLFNSKCAYCESVFLHVYSGDVEHYRPKGEITEASPATKPGYYWLAADWDNLLLSCRNCNQKLKHSIFGTSNLMTMGKMNQFPLSDSSKYVRNHNDPSGIKGEEPYRLLLNPCLENPEFHLEYGQEGVIRAKKDNNNIPSHKGQKSIEVYVLQRVSLVQQREKTLIDIQAQIQRVLEGIKKYIEFLDHPDQALRLYFERILERELQRLKKFLNPDEPYLGMARQVIGEFLDVNFGIII